MTAKATSYEVIDLASGNCIATFAFLREAKTDLQARLEEGAVTPRGACLVAFDAAGTPVWSRVVDPSWLAPSNTHQEELGASASSNRARKDRSTSDEHAGMDRFFTSFSNWVAKWTGSHWAFTIVAILVVALLALTSVEMTNITISVVTLLMVFVLQNTQNRDSAALHLKLDEIVRVEPKARDDVRGVESKSAREIEELTRTA